MTHPSIHARTNPDKIAYQMAGTGKAITYRELDELSNRGAHLFRALGLKAGDHVAFLMENRLAFMEICWAAQRAGLYYTAISRYLAQDEIGYIVKDCGAQVVVTSPKCAEQIKRLVTGAPGEPEFFMLDEPLEGFRCWDKEAIAQPVTPIADESADYDMLYSSGTTGRPKGIKKEFEGKRIDARKSVPVDALRQHVRHGAGHDLSVAGAALPRGPLALQHDGSRARRHVDHHGILRCGGVLAVGREAQGHAFAAGADHVRPHAEAFGRGAQPLRPFLVETCYSRRGPLPDRREGQDDRMVGPDPDRILCRLRRQRRHRLQRARVARASR
jgi:hypothetical protein